VAAGLPPLSRPGHIFVVGDNLENSNDSRYPAIGQVPLAAVIGKVVEIVEPGSRGGTIIPAPTAAAVPGPGGGSSTVVMAPSPRATAGGQDPPAPEITLAPSPGGAGDETPIP